MGNTAPQQSGSTEASEDLEVSPGKSQTTPILLGILIVLILTLTGWYFFTNQNKPAPKEPEVAATVNGEKILKSTYQSFYDAQKYYWETVYTSTLKQPKPTSTINTLPNVVLDDLIKEVLLRQYLAKKSISVSDSEVRSEIKKQVVDPNWKGDWTTYEADLQKTYHTSLGNMMHTFRTRLLVDRITTAEKLSGSEFGIWYQKLKSQADIKTYVSEYKQQK